MTRLAPVFDAFLRVVLSCALVMSLTPILNDTAYAAQSAPRCVQNVEQNQETRSQDASFQEMSSQDAPLQEAPLQAERVQNVPLQNEQTYYEYGKLKDSGYVYECDSTGAILHEVDEQNPEVNAISAKAVETLFIDKIAGTIADSLCYGSAYLKEVHFEGERVTTIGQYAFAQCANLKEVNFQFKSIQEIGTGAFSGCTSLTQIGFLSTQVYAMGEDCFAGSGLTSTGLSEIRELEAVPKGTYRNCASLTDTELTETGRITSIGEEAFANCTSLRFTGLEDNTSVTSLGEGCFEGCDLSGGFLIAKHSNLSSLPARAFANTNLDYVFLYCEQAVQIAENTFPKQAMKVLIPAETRELYEAEEVRSNWEQYNGTLPSTPAESKVCLEITQDPSTMTFTAGDMFTPNGMMLSFGYGGNTKEYTYDDLLHNYVFSQFIDLYPCEEYLDSNDNGAYITAEYDDRDILIRSYSAGALHENNSTNLTVFVKTENAQHGDSFSGSGSYAPGSQCRVSAVWRSSASGTVSTFAYWKDETGNKISEDYNYEFTLDRNRVFTAVFANSVRLQPSAQLVGKTGTAPQDIDVSVWADSYNEHHTYDTYEGKEVTLVCTYDDSKYRFDHWENSVDRTVLGTSASLNYTTRVGEKPVAVLGEYGQLNVSAKTLDSYAQGTVEGSGRCSTGETVTLSATPAAGSKFVGWVHHGELVSAEETYSYYVLDFDDVVGWFAIDPTQWVIMQASSVQPDMGTVEGAGVYLKGAPVTLTATPGEGCIFTGWLCGDQSIESNTTLVLSAAGESLGEGRVNVSPQYQATFDYATYSVSYAQVVDTGGREVMEGVSIPSVAGETTAKGRHESVLDASQLGMTCDDISFVGWYDAQTGALLCETEAYAFTPTSNMRLEARFTLKEVAVCIQAAQATDSSEQYAHVTVEEGNYYRNNGETLSLAATAENAQFRGWYAECGDDTTLISDQLTCTYTVNTPANGTGGNAGGESVQDVRVEITPWYCAQQASVVLSVNDTDDAGNPLGQFFTTGLYGIGSQVTVNAVPTAGYVFEKITNNQGTVVSTKSDGSYTFTLTEDTQLTAHFRQAANYEEAVEALKVTLMATITSLAAVAAAYGIAAIVEPIATEALAAIAGTESLDELAEIAAATLGDLEELVESHKKDKDPDKPKSDSRQVEIVAVADPLAGGIVYGYGQHAEGTVAELQAIANPGYRFVCWQENGVERSKSPLLTMAITEATPDAVSLVAVFEKDVVITTSIQADEAVIDALTGCKATPDRQTAQRGKEVVVSAVEGDNYAFVGWFEEGLKVSGEHIYTFAAEADRNLVAKFHKTVKTITTKASPEEGGSAVVQYQEKSGAELDIPEGENATLIATPNKGYKFERWTDDSNTEYTEATLEIRVEDNTTYTAVFSKLPPEVLISADPWQGGAVTCNGVTVTSETEGFYVGDTLHLVAQANDEYAFCGWYVNGAPYSFATECTVQATPLFNDNDRCVIVASFKPKSTVCVPVASPATGGSVQVQRITAESGVQHALKAQALPGYMFTGWYSQEGELESQEAEFTCTNTTNHVHLAHFEECAYTVDATPVMLDSTGTMIISPRAGFVKGTGNVDAGLYATLTAQAFEGYVFEYWADTAGNKVSDQAEYRFVPAENTKFCAVFSQQQFSVNVSVTENLGQVTGAGAYAANSLVELFATAAEGARFLGWYSNGVCLSTRETYRFVVRSDMHIQALFASGSFAVTTTALPTEAGYTSGFGAFAQGDQTTLRAFAKTGFSFECWQDAQGHVVSRIPECSVTVTDNAQYTAYFARNCYEVTLGASGTDAALLSGEGTYSFGQVIELKATQTSDKRFMGWYVIDSEGSLSYVNGNAHCWVPVNEAVVEKAQEETLQFVACFADPYEVGVNAQVVVKDKQTSRGCKVVGTGAVLAGNEVTLSAVAGIGYRFVGWSTNEAGSNIFDTNASLCFTAESDVLYYAQFESDQQITVTVAPNSKLQGSAVLVSEGSTAAEGTYDWGDVFVALAVPCSGYHFVHWTSNDATVVSNSALYVGFARSNLQLTACFEANDKDPSKVYPPAPDGDSSGTDSTDDAGSGDNDSSGNGTSPNNSSGNNAGASPNVSANSRQNGQQGFVANARNAQEIEVLDTSANQAKTQDGTNKDRASAQSSAEAETDSEAQQQTGNAFAWVIPVVLVGAAAVALGVVALRKTRKK